MDAIRCSVDGNETEVPDQQLQEEEEEANQHVLKLLDSMDSYLTLVDSLSPSLRKGWLEIASARHSMGASRINSALLDLNFHTAATSLKVGLPIVNSMAEQPKFGLSKWALPDDEQFCNEEGKYDGDKLMMTSKSLLLRDRETFRFSESQENIITSNRSLSSIDGQIQRGRAKALSVFGALVSPKLRAAQISFETALETLVEIANTRSSMLCAFNQVAGDMAGFKA